MTTPRCNLVQTAFLMNMSANAVSMVKAKRDELVPYFTSYLYGGRAPDGTKNDGFFPTMNPLMAGGDWDVVWGPCVYAIFKEKPWCLADNAM